jgi:hypothetical protein
MIQPLSAVGNGVSAVVRRVGRAFLSVGQVVEKMVHVIGRQCAAERRGAGRTLAAVSPGP